MKSLFLENRPKSTLFNVHWRKQTRFSVVDESDGPKKDRITTMQSYEIYLKRYLFLSLLRKE